MLGDEGGHLLYPIVSGQEGAQAHRAVENFVELVDVGDTLGVGQLEELLV